MLPVVSPKPVEWCVELDDVGAKEDKVPHLEGTGERCLSPAVLGPHLGQGAAQVGTSLTCSLFSVTK